MSLHYFIDGYNVIRSSDLLSEGSWMQQRVKLLTAVDEGGLCGSPRHQVTVIFDGRSGPGWTLWKGRARVVYSLEKEADQVIKESVDSMPNPRNAVVVTNDRAIQKWVSGAGAAVISCEEFLKPLAVGHARVRTARMDPSTAARINAELKSKWGIE